MENGSVATQNNHSLDNEKLALAAEIIKGRERLGMTQAQLAAASSVSLSAIKGYETGRTFPGAKELRQICATLRVSPNVVLFGDENPFPPSALPSTGEDKALRVHSGRVRLLLDMLSSEEVTAVYALVHSIALARFGAHEVNSRLEGADFMTGLAEVKEGKPLDPEMFRLILNSPETTREFIAALKSVQSELQQQDSQKGCIST